MNKFQILCSCIKCKQETTTGQLTRNHKDECPKKTKVQYPNNFGRMAWNKGKTSKDDVRIANAAKKLKEGYISGKNKLSGCATMTTEKRKELAKKYNLGGYRENAGRSKKYKVYDSLGNQTTLQSTYEYAVFEILCELGIRWVRPKALKYKNKNYFADFYLLDFDIWLDPKNSYKAKLDENKINSVIEENKCKVVVILEKQITKDFIARII